MKLLYSLLLLLSALFGSSLGKKVVCYFTNWSSYRNGIGKFGPSDIDPRLCTHIMYAFSVVENNRLKIFDQWLDVDNDYLSRVGEVRKANPSVKVMMAIGGWNAGSTTFSNMAKSASTRKIFIDSVVEFMKKYDYDGLDLDWEYPAKRGGIPADKENFSLLIKELQKRFLEISRSSGRAKMLLTAAVSAAPATASVAYDKPTICSDLDFVNLMQYDIHGAWDSTTGHAAPLYATPEEVDPQNVLDTTTKDWINAGCDREKLIFGIPMYGRGWSLNAGSSPGVGASGNPGKPGPYVGESGMLSYAEICNKLSNGWKESYDAGAEQAIAFGDNQWYSYDNERSVRAKVNYINSMRLGGAMIWALDFDDFNGQACGRGRYPLLSIISKGMVGGSTNPAPRPVTRASTTTTTPQSTTVIKSTSTTQQPTTTVWSTTTTQQPTTTTWSTTTAAWSTTTTPQPSTAESTTTSRPTKPILTGCQPSCQLTSGVAFLADSCDQQKFYMCYLGNAYQMNCSPGTVFVQRYRMCA